MENEPFSAEDIQEDLCHYETLAMYGCHLLSQTDCTFHMSGFGDDNWPLDVGYDMSTVIESLPEVLGFVRSHTSGELNMYSQGVERTLKFSSENDRAAIRCYSRTSWVPDPVVELMEYPELHAMFERLAMDFAASLNLIRPDVAGVQPFSTWLQWSIADSGSGPL